METVGGIFLFLTKMITVKVTFIGPGYEIKTQRSG